MMTRLAALLLAAVAIAVPARADEDASSHADHPHKTVILGKLGAALPSDLTMDKGDVLVFENYSSGAITIRFTEPADQTDKIHCGLVRPKASKNAPPWAKFSFDDRKRLTATLPPGQFASLCSLAPGNYVYETSQAFGAQVGTRQPGKHTVTVQ
jgi:hypothetical protein